MSKEKNNNTLKRFGKYLILDHLVDGGMAQICRARFLGEQVDKIVAIKMIRSQYSQNPSFQKMFMDEIKVTFSLIHPNIAQTYDYGMLDGQLYTAMEYVDGKNLKQYIDRLKEKKFIFPLEMTTFIISQVCQALSYAHTFTEKLSGRPLNIIHRDISPHNIMISYEGVVKVIDFGIAKAATNSEETQAGMIKGKLSYLAPEYLEGAPLDPNYDQFAVGITLWEMLCNRRLFQAENELATLKKIQKCQVPVPSSINSKVPKELDDIVLKSLSKRRDMRFANMDQLNRALVKFLYSKYPDFNATDLKFFSQELFKKDIKADPEKFYEYGKIDITSYIEEMNNESGAGRVASNAPSPVEKAKINKQKVLDFDDEDQNISVENSKKIGLDVNKGTKRNATSFLKAPFQVHEKFSGKNRKLPDKMYSSSNQKSRPQNTVSLPSGVRGIGDGRGGIFGKVVGLFLVIGILAVGYLKKDLFFGDQTRKIARDEGDKKSKKKYSKNITAKQTIETRQGTKTIYFTNTNPFQVYYINQKKIDYSISGVEVPMNTDINLRIEQEGRHPIFLKFQITKDTKTSNYRLPKSKKGIFGVLRSEEFYPDGATLTYQINGNKVVRNLPFEEDLKIPVGKYRGTIFLPDINSEKEVSFDIVENVITNLGK